MNDIKRKMWVDDERLPPSEFDVWCRTGEDAIRILQLHWGKIEVLSLDHDLGDETKLTGYDVVKFIEEKVFVDHLEPTMEFRIHSQNPVGVDNMSKAIDAIYRHLEKWRS